MSYKNDLAVLNESQNHIQKVVDRLTEIYKIFKQMQEIRKQINQNKPVSFEEYLKTQHKITIPSPEQKSYYERSYQQYLDLQSRKRDELTSRIETLKQKCNEQVQHSIKELRYERDQIDRILHQLNKLCKIVDDINLTLQKPSAQINLDNIQSAIQNLRESKYIKETDFL